MSSGGRSGALPGEALAERARRLVIRLLPSTLGTRLALTYAGLALAVMVILAVALEESVREFSVSQLVATLGKEAAVAGDLVLPVVQDGANGAHLVAVTTHLAQALDSRVTVIAADGTVLADSAHDAATMENHLGRPEVQQALRAGLGSAIRPSATLGAPYLYVARALPEGRGVVRLSLSLESVDHLVWGIQRQVAIAALLAAALMIGAGWFVARRIGGGLKELEAQAVSVAAGRLDASVVPAPTRELGALGRAFNTMTLTLRDTVAELERMHARLDATLADLSDGVVITDARGGVVLANDAALAMLAAQPPGTGTAFLELARDHELNEMAQEALAGQGAAERVVDHGRSGRTLQAVARRLDAASERIGVIVLRDITELRRLEGMRRDFVANVSHELRTPLTSIRALAETLESGALDDPTVSTEFVQRIIAEVDRLAVLVDELLELARLESGRTRLTLSRDAVGAAIEHAVLRMAPQTARAGLTVEVDVAVALPTVMFDRVRIEQVFLNLIDNAVKFTPRGGQIVVRAEHAGDAVLVRVEDSGIGVRDDDLNRLFERFYKVDPARRSQGTGLGLAIAKHIVQAHDGAIWAERNTPRGTVFAFTLPIEGPPMAGDDPFDDRWRGLGEAGP